MEAEKEKEEVDNHLYIYNTPLLYKVLGKETETEKQKEEEEEDGDHLYILS